MKTKNTYDIKLSGHGKSISYEYKKLDSLFSEKMHVVIDYFIESLQSNQCAMKFLDSEIKVLSKENKNSEIVAENAKNDIWGFKFLDSDASFNISNMLVKLYYIKNNNTHFFIYANSHCEWHYCTLNSFFINEPLTKDNVLDAFMFGLKHDIHNGPDIISFMLNKICDKSDKWVKIHGM